MKIHKTLTDPVYIKMQTYCNEIEIRQRFVFDAIFILIKFELSKHLIQLLHRHLLFFAVHLLCMGQTPIENWASFVINYKMQKWVLGTEVGGGFRRFSFHNPHALKMINSNFQILLQELFGIFPQPRRLGHSRKKNSHTRKAC